MHVVKPMSNEEAVKLLWRINKVIERLTGLVELQVEQLTALKEGVSMAHNGLLMSMQDAQNSKDEAVACAQVKSKMEATLDAAEAIANALTSPNGEGSQPA